MLSAQNPAINKEKKKINVSFNNYAMNNSSDAAAQEGHSEQLPEN